MAILAACLPLGKTIGGSITGLTGAGLVLQNNAADDLAVTAGATHFSFAKTIASGGNYAVSILTQPQNQACTVSNGSGTVADSNISNVSINCVAEDKHHFVYLLNDGQKLNTISAYSISESSGVLSAVPGSPFSVGSNAGKTGSKIIVDPAGRFIYMIRYQAKLCTVGNGPGPIDVIVGFCPMPVNISAYSINRSTGALTTVPGGPFATGSKPKAITIDPTGKFAYVDGLGGLHVFSINNSTGALTEVPGAGSAMPNGYYEELVFDPSGKFVFSSLSEGFNTYNVDTNTGALTLVPGSPFFPYYISKSYPFSPSGQFAYVLGSDGNSHIPVISSYSIDTNAGTITAVPGSPFSLGGYYATGIKIAPSGKFAYVNTSTDYYSAPCNISTYAINDSTGVWDTVAVGSVSASFCSDIHFDSTGKFAYMARIVDQGHVMVTGYAVNDSTGALTPLPASPFSIETNSVTFDPSGKFAYTLTTDSPGSGTISAYAIDATSGALAPVIGSQPLPTGGGGGYWSLVSAP